MTQPQSPTLFSSTILKIFTFVIFCVFFLINYGYAQIIKGSVLEEGTNKPLAKASIYFEGTFRGTVTNDDGEFSLDIRGIEQQLPLTISTVGYFSQTIFNYRSVSPKVYLKPKVQELKEVVIGFDGMTREEKLKQFKAEFLGNTNNSKLCQILNEDDLSFTYSKKTGTLKAFSDNPLIIQNKSLGYKITYYLDRFEKSPKQMIFIGNYFFKEDSIAGKEKDIIKRREKAYVGSRMHFIRSLWENQLKENKFKVYSSKSVELNYDDLVVEKGSQKYLTFPSFVQIDYNGDRSRIFRKATEMFFDSNGYFPASSIEWEGIMARPRIADLLPFEYIPVKQKKSNALPYFSNDIQRLVTSIDTFNKALPAERVFVHTDKPYYSIGDTIWLKTYLFDGSTLSNSRKSGIIYVELISDSLRVSRQISMPVIAGLAWGQIPLDEGTFPEGFYTLRAYTNWMQNFGEDSFFKKNFYIADARSPHWLVSEQHHLQKNNEQGKLSFAFQLKNMDGTPLNFTEIKWRLQDGKKTLLKSSSQSLDGKVEGEVEISGKPKAPLTIVAEGSRPSQKAIIPLHLDSPNDIDLQFMPEGGHLVAGLPSRVAFKAIDANGLGVDVEGTIFDNKNNELTSFKSMYKGMGSLELSPSRGDVYIAKVKMKDGSTKVFNLPAVKNSGTVLRITNSPKSDSIKIAILISEDLLDGKTYRLAGFARGKTCYGASFQANKQRAIAIISKEMFPSGVAHFTLFNENDQPLCERITFINHKDFLDIEPSIDRTSFNPKDSIPLAINVTDAAGSPTVASLSVAVTDDNVVEIDSLKENLITSALLSSELKGYIENPWYYFSAGSDVAYYLDLLMLTQGWRGYNWDAIFKPVPEPRFRAEPELKVSGKVTNVMNKPVEKSKVTLFSTSKSVFFRDTITNSLGTFEFKDLPPTDTIKFFIQAKNPRGRSFNISVQMDEFKPAKVVDSLTVSAVPWYVNTDTTLLGYLQKSHSEYKKKQLALLKSGKLLDGVTITGKRIIKNSKNLNGPGEADQIVDEEQIRSSGTKDLIFLLMNRINGFQTKVRRDGSRFYAVHNTEVRFVVDGLYIDRFLMGSDQDEKFNLLTDGLNSMDIEDVIGLEVMMNLRYKSRYDFQHLDPRQLMNMDSNFVYIEITTRSGNGFFAKSTPGTVVYKPMPLTWPKQFYRPKYVANKTVKDPGLRSTIHWEPCLLSKNGQAFTSFYAADKPATYSVLIQGADMNGSVGYKMMKITVDGKK